MIIIAFLICVVAFFPVWFFGTMTANLLGVYGPAAGIAGFVFAVVVMILFGWFLVRITRPASHPVKRP